MTSTPQVNRVVHGDGDELHRGLAALPRALAVAEDLGDATPLQLLAERGPAVGGGSAGGLTDTSLTG
jgi:hypothetical protein